MGFVSAKQERVKPFLSLLALFSAALAVTANPPAAAGGIDTCPGTVVLVARGSDQNEAHGEQVGPQRYAEHAPASTGFEGRNFAALFHHVERRHPGTMDDVFVLALDDVSYPATMNLPPLAHEGEELSPRHMLLRVGEIVQEHPVGELVRSVTWGAIQSVRTGITNAPMVVADYEDSTGCHPRWVVAGYSQGAVVTTSVEAHLAKSGRLHGVITMGSPLHQLPWVRNRAGLPADRYVDYCLPDDFACDFSLSAAGDALATKAQRHASYFLGELSGQDVQVIDAVAGILTTHD